MKGYVVTGLGCNGRYSFIKFHETIDIAKEEAERLCKKEGTPFLVLKVVGFCQIEEKPVKWVEESV